MIAERPVTLATSDGAGLEGRLAVPAAARAAIVICHPHPLYGGDMDNPVVVRIQAVCAELDFATLRFNFRGVGASTGTHDGGRAEQHDVAAALECAGKAAGGVPTVLAGYSFGAVVSAGVAAREPALAGLALIAPPVGLAGLDAFAPLAAFASPLLVVAGSADEYCPRPALDELARRLPRATVSVIPDANHFFFGKLYPLGNAVAGWARGLEAGQARRGSRAG
jgi:alpha/beta superfamily hydrolase